MAAKAEKKMHFGDAFAELEKITEWFEKEEMDLEEGLEKFERGLALAAKLKARLSEVENRIEEIKVQFSAADDDTDDADSEEKAETPF
ncbi:exodeoxyribonuclease VII small subunit [Patescibacteria group bacterium]|nr:exodeoxyribonuclease VII small subunit [Patescibacteria group bacterium]